MRKMKRRRKKKEEKEESAPPPMTNVLVIVGLMKNRCSDLRVIQKVLLPSIRPSIHPRLIFLSFCFTRFHAVSVMLATEQPIKRQG